MKQILISSSSIQKLIDTLISSGKGGTGHDKFKSILIYLTKSENDAELVESYEKDLVYQVMLLFEMVGVIDITDPGSLKYNIKKPIYFQSCSRNSWLLVGALSYSEIVKLKENGLEFSTQEYSYLLFKKSESVELKINIELPIISFNLVQISDAFPENISTVIPQSYLLLDDVNIQNPDTFSIYDFEKQPFVENSILISEIDNLRVFNWRSRNMEYRDLRSFIKDLDKPGLYFISFAAFTKNYTKTYHYLMESDNQYVGDKPTWQISILNKIDPRWGRYLFMQKLTYYNLDLDIDNYNLPDGFLDLIAAKIDIHKPNSSVPSQVEREDGKLKAFLTKNKKLIFYDQKKEWLGIPAFMPLPREISQALFLCSGAIPKIYDYDYIQNPDYPLMEYFRGKGVKYKLQDFFKPFKFQVFIDIPKPLANKVCKLVLGEDNKKNSFYSVSI